MKGAEVIDLVTAECSNSATSDICIIGAGAAGAYLARRLSESGLRVVCLEAGGLQGQAPEEIGFLPSFLSSEYPGALVGRSFGMGGSTSRWGGLLVPHSHYDCRDSDSDGLQQTWEHIVSCVSNHSETVLRSLGFDAPPEFNSFADTHLGVEQDSLRAVGLGVVSSIFLPYRRKNLVHLLEENSAEPKPRVFINAVAKDWLVDGGGRVNRVTAVSAGGNELTIESHQFVIAAGAIETARILLEVDSAAPAGIELSQETGRCLGDHLSVPIADVGDSCLARTVSTYGPRFQGSWMRSFRFMELSPPTGVPRGFSHFVFENDNAGFALARTVLGAVQSRQLPRINFGEAVRGMSGVCGLARDRFLHSRLYIPPRTRTRLQLDIEQLPDARNRIQLGSERDRYGRQVAAIDWRITKSDMRQVTAAAGRLLALWQAKDGGLPTLVPRDLRSDSQKPHDAYHPVGVCRMGDDQDSVVDLDLSVRGVKNLSVVSTAVLPSAGTANPTFTMLCLADRLVDRFLIHRK